MKKLLTVNNFLAIFASVLLLFIDWLAFHDIGETHTVRDYLLLVASGMVFIVFAWDFWEQFVQLRASK